MEHYIEWKKRQDAMASQPNKPEQEQLQQPQRYGNHELQPVHVAPN